MTLPKSDAHRGHPVPGTRVEEELWPQVQDVAREFDVSVNWLINQALHVGLPRVLRHLQQMRADVR